MKLLVKVLCYLLLVAAIAIALSALLAALDLYSGGNIDSIKFFSEDGSETGDMNLRATMDRSTIYLVAVINTWVLYVAWMLCYIFWHQLKNRKKLQRQVREAQIQQLTNQLSPHFLFNTFNSIRALIFEDQEKAANMVTELSELFRAHLQAHMVVYSTLEEEWEIASKYLAIEQARQEDHMIVRIDLDDDLLQQKMPRLALLTLVENAIKHGIAPNAEPGRLVISANKLTAQCWQLSVENTFNQPSLSVSNKTGLVNLKTRLNLMFKKQHRLSASEVNQTFKVEMELPLD